MKTHDDILEILRVEALGDRSTGWLSDMGNFRLKWDEQNSAIVIDDSGSIDVGHLAGIISEILEGSR